MSANASVTVIDKLPVFAKEMANIMDDAIAETAKDILIGSRQRAPFDKGALRRESDIRQMKLLLWRVSYWVEYARFQELGGTANRRVRNYTTSGTGAHFLQQSGDEQVKKLVGTITKHAGRVRA